MWQAWEPGTSRACRFVARNMNTEDRIKHLETYIQHLQAELKHLKSQSSQAKQVRPQQDKAIHGPEADK